MRTSHILRIIAVSFLAASRALLAEDFPFENPVAGKEAKATFTTNSDGATAVQVSDNHGAALLQQDLPKQAVQSARWTEDGKFLVITSRNSEGHSPWRYTVDVFSVDAREIRLLSDDKKRPPFISSDIWCQAADTVILVGHTFSHKIPTPALPVR